MCVASSRLESLYDTVALERRKDQVGDPQAEEDARGDDARPERSAELAADARYASDHHEQDGEHAERAEYGHRERQTARHHDELGAIVRVIDGGGEPGQADAQKDVDRIRAGHVAHRAVGVLVLNGRHFACERV